MAARVLVVEDDPTLADVLRGYLQRAGFTVLMAADGEHGLELCRTGSPDLVVLDVMLPRLSGLEVLRRVRAEGIGVLVLVLSALGEDDDRIVGLEQGADDYVAKPFSPRELVLRVQGLLRRREPVAGSGLVPRTLAVGGLRLDLAARTVHRHGTLLALSHREFDLLAFLADHPGEAFTKTALLRRVWGWDFGDTSTVTVHVRRLREKVEADPSAPQLVVTVWGVGYRLDPAPVQLGGAGALQTSPGASPGASPQGSPDASTDTPPGS